MPRPIRKPSETPQAAALDQTRRAFDRAEANLDRLREELKACAVAAVKAGMTKSEAGRRAGYSREYVHGLVKAAEEQAED